MSDDLEPLSAAAICRVYAVAGQAIVWTPEQLRRFAGLLDENERLRHKALRDSAKMRREVRWWFWATIVLNGAMLGVWWNV